MKHLTNLSLKKHIQHIVSGTCLKTPLSNIESFSTCCIFQVGRSKSHDVLYHLLL